MKKGIIISIILCISLGATAAYTLGSRSEYTLGQRVCTDDMTPVEITLESERWQSDVTPPPPISFNIPKAYLLYSEQQKGGTFGFTTVSINTDKLQPACIDSTDTFPPALSASITNIQIKPTPLSTTEDDIIKKNTELTKKLYKLDQPIHSHDVFMYQKPDEKTLNYKYYTGTAFLFPEDRSYHIDCGFKKTNVINVVPPKICKAFIKSNQSHLTVQFHTVWLQDFDILKRKIDQVIESFIINAS